MHFYQLSDFNAAIKNKRTYTDLFLTCYKDTTQSHRDRERVIWGEKNNNKNDQCDLLFYGQLIQQNANLSYACGWLVAKIS